MQLSENDKEYEVISLFDEDEITFQDIMEELLIINLKKQ